MALSQQEIKELILLSNQHNRDAQLKLGKYYGDLPCSNNNFEQATKYLKLVAEKHNSESIRLLILVYTKYLTYLIANDKGINRINLVYELGIKWCNIGIKENIPLDFSSYRKNLDDIYISGKKDNASLDIHYRIKKVFKKQFLISIIVLVMLFGVFGGLIATKNMNQWYFAIICALIFVTLTVIGLIIWTHIHDRRKNTLKHVEKTSTVVEDNNVYSKDKSLNNLAKYQVSKKTDNQLMNRGYLGELFFSYLLEKETSLPISLLNKKKLGIQKIISTKWSNDNGVESTEPYDFIIDYVSKTNTNNKIYVEVKTTAARNKKEFYLSDKQISFAKMHKDSNKYLICYLSNFMYENVLEFPKGKKPFITFIDFNNDEEMKQYTVRTK